MKGIIIKNISKLKNGIFARNSNDTRMQFAIIAFITFLSELILFRNTGINNALVDFTYQLENAYRISVGQVPYRDFFLVLTPGIYYLDALFLNIFHQSNIGQVVLLLLIHFVQILLSYLILKKLSDNRILVCLGICVIAFSESIFYPFVIYNTASYDMMLICIYYYLKNRNKNGYEKEDAFVMGMLLTLPIYFKQNFGLFFMVAFYLYLIIEGIIEKKIRFLFGLMVGSLTSVAVFLCFLHIQRISISQFVYQTLIFPGEAKHPIKIIISNCIGAIGRPVVLYGILILTIALFVTYSIFSDKFTRIAAYIVFAFAFMVLPYLSHIISANTSYNVGAININTVLWYLLYHFLAFIWLKDCLFQKQLLSQKSILIVCFFVFTFGIFTKRLDGPSWLWVFAIVLLAKNELSKYIKQYFALILTSMLIWNLHSARTVNLAWVDQSGDLYQERDISSNFYKIGANGNWIPEIENLSFYIGKKIGDASFVEMPCEDPIYWSSLKTPQLDFFQAYPETCPYKADDFAEIISQNDIEYIIVKKNCQFKYYMINENNIDDFIDQIIMKGYLKIEGFDSYEVYRKARE